MDAWDSAPVVARYILPLRNTRFSEARDGLFAFVAPAGIHPDAVGRPASWYVPALNKRGDAGDALADHQLVNVVRPLVGVHALEVVHVPHNAVIVHDAVRTEDIP